MEITININDERFEQVSKDALSSLTKEEIADICREALTKILSDPTKFEQLVKIPDSWNYNTGKETIRDIILNASKTIDLSPIFEDVKNNIFEYVNANKENLVKDILTEFFLNGLEASIFNSTDFKNRVSFELYNHLNKN